MAEVQPILAGTAAKEARGADAGTTRHERTNAESSVLGHQFSVPTHAICVHLWFPSVPSSSWRLAFGPEVEPQAQARWGVMAVLPLSASLIRVFRIFRGLPIRRIDSSRVPPSAFSAGRPAVLSPYRDQRRYSARTRPGAVRPSLRSLKSETLRSRWPGAPDNCEVPAPNEPKLGHSG